MGKTTAYKLLQAFIYNHIDGGLRKRIQRWLISDMDITDKEDALESLWNEAEVDTQKNIHQSFVRTQEKIKQRVPRHPSYFLIRRLARVAAILLLPLLASVTTFYFIKSDYQPVEMVECFVPNGAYKNITLADGTEVKINSGSYLIYPESFNGKTRTIYLQGEANFTVAKNKEKPFIVKTSHVSVEAIGTKFNVRAYPDSHYTTTILEEGCVHVNISDSSSLSTLLKVNEQLTYYHYSKTIDLAIVDATKATSWQDGYLIFQETPMEEIISTLERKYDVEINYDRDKLNGKIYYVEFSPDNTLEETLSVLEDVTGKFSFQIKKKN